MVAQAKKTVSAKKPSLGKTYPLMPLPVSKIDLSDNYRKKVGDLTELATSIKLHGVQQPVLVRVLKKTKGFQLVFGQRRVLAAKEAGLSHVPALVAEEMDDAEFYELQMIENGQREDVHPLEEAEGYERWLKASNPAKSADALAERVGKSRSSIYNSLKLLDLVKEGRKAFYEGVLTASTAVYVARIPHPKLQVEAVEELKRHFTGWHEPMSARAVQDLVQRRYMLELKGAPFNRKDAQLVPEAGACTACPKRSGNCKVLFPDVKDEDVCTDPGCFQKKSEVNWAQIQSKAQEKGQRVLSEKEAAKVLYPRGEVMYSAPYVRLDEKCQGDAEGRTYKQLLKGALPESVVARAPSGHVVELVSKEDVKRALKDAGHDVEAKAVTDDAYKKDQEKRARARKVGEETEKEVLTELVAAAEKSKDQDFLLRLMVAVLLSNHEVDDEEIAARRGVQPQGLNEHIKAMASPQLNGLLLELVLKSAGALYESWREDYSQTFEMVCAALGVDLKAFHAQNMKHQLDEDRKKKQKKEAKLAKQQTSCAAEPASDTESVH